MIVHEIFRVLTFVVNSCVHISGYLLVCILISSAFNIYGITKYIKLFLTRHEKAAIISGALIGCTIPICSCGVIPMIAAMVTSGVPMGPIMAFWLTSPIMDTTTFFLTWGVIGLDMAIARFVSAIFIGCVAGYITSKFIKNYAPSLDDSMSSCCSSRDSASKLGQCCNLAIPQEDIKFDVNNALRANACACVSSSPDVLINGWIQIVKTKLQKYKIKELLSESLKLGLFIGKWLIVAYFLEAVLIFYLPADFMEGLFRNIRYLEIPIASIVGIPMYVNNVSGIPLVEGLIEMGLSRGAALTFLIAGPITTIPAMIAVYKIVNRKVFILYLLVGFLGALICGYAYQFITKLGC